MKTTNVNDDSIFIKLSDYKAIVELVNSLHNKLDKAKKLISDLEAIKKEEESELDQWKEIVSNLGQKLEFIEGTLFEPENT